MKSTALLLIDLQNDFCANGALPVPDGDSVINIANQAIDYFQLQQCPVIASLDWHPASHRSFASNSGKQIGESGELNGLPQIWWPIHCVQNSHGAQFHPLLQHQQIDKIIYKGQQPDIDSYSAFFDNGKCHETELSSWLKQKAISRLWIMGLATDYCVKFSVLDALRVGFEARVITDGCRGVNLHPNDSQQAFAEMEQQGARLLTLQQAIATKL